MKADVTTNTRPQLEHELLRGAGPRGLAAMPVLSTGVAGRSPVLRPLLETTKDKRW